MLEFGRYYFITDIASIRTSLWRISLAVDVLESFKDDILQQRAIIGKQQAEGALVNRYYDDNSFQYLAKTATETKNFSGGFNDSGTFVLICAGG